MEKLRPALALALLVMLEVAVVDQTPTASAWPTQGCMRLPHALVRIRGGGKSPNLPRMLKRKSVKDPPRLDATALLDMFTRGQYSRDLVRPAGLPLLARTWAGTARCLLITLTAVSVSVVLGFGFSVYSSGVLGRVFGLGLGPLTNERGANSNP